MDRFWYLLAKVNARGVFLVVLLVLVSVTAWFCYSVMTGGRGEPVPLTLEEARRTWVPLGPDSVAGALQYEPAEDTNSTPFASPAIDIYLARKEAERIAAEKAAAEKAAIAKAAAEKAAAEKAAAEKAAAEKAAAEKAAAEKAAAEKAALEPPPPPPPPPVPPVKLVYRGMLSRTDGKVLALVENKASGQTLFYAEGDTVAGVVVGKITARTIDYTPPGTNSATVVVGAEYEVKGE